MGKHVRRAVSPITRVCGCNRHNADFRRVSGYREHPCCGDCYRMIQGEAELLEYMRRLILSGRIVMEVKP